MKSNKLRFLLLVAAAVMLAALFTACNSSDKAKEDADNEKNNEGYYFIYNDVVIKPDGDMQAVCDALGEPTNYFEAASCAFSGLDKTYTYGGLQINTYPDGAKDKILSIILLDDSNFTPEGVTIGSEVSEVLAAYGENYTQSGTAMVYSKGNTVLKFLLRDGCVTSVQYFSTIAD